MFQTTRRRLALWYTAVTAVLLLLFASGVFLYVRSTLVERIDDTLNHVIEVVERSLVIEPDKTGALHVNVELSFRDNEAARDDDRIDLEWFSSSGDLLWSTFNEPLNLPIRPNSNGETVEIHRPDDPLLDLTLRQITQSIDRDRHTLGYLRVSHPWFEVTKPSRQLFLDLSLGTSLMISAVGAIGWFLSGLAMEPVRDSYQRLKQFTADASHELRSPIAIIQTNVQVALADPDPDLQNHHLKVIERLTRRLGRLVDDLLFLARQDSGMVQVRSSNIRLDRLIKEVIEEQRTLAQEKSITLTLTLDEGTLDTMVVSGDRDQLARLFTNLVSNAIQYTPDQGQITIALQRSKTDPASVTVRIQDTGIGIAPDDLPRLFDRFYRVDAARTQKAGAGSGLGLAIAQAIVDVHHGHIAIASQLGQGTVVSVTLPQSTIAG